MTATATSQRVTRTGRDEAGRAICAPTQAEQQTARIMGAWFLGTFVFSIPAFWFYDPVLNHANYVVGRGDDTRVAVGALLENLVGHVPRAATCTAVMTSYTRNTNPTAAVPTATTIKECS